MLNQKMQTTIVFADKLGQRALFKQMNGRSVQEKYKEQIDEALMQLSNEVNCTVG